MLIQSIVRTFVFLLFVNSAFAAAAPAVDAQNSPAVTGERFALGALQTIHAAEMTFSATAGAGNFGSLQQLRSEGFIDAVLATGEKYGYSFAVTVTPHTQTTAAGFYLTAVPQRYGKGGKRSFYLDLYGVIYGADHNGAPATANDPLVPPVCGENRVVSLMWQISSAEAAYQSTFGASINYGTLTQLAQARLVDGYIATGQKCGYQFGVTVIAAVIAVGVPATFRVNAEPLSYPNTGIRSYYIDQTGILRGADKRGAPANAKDPPIEY